MIKKYGFLSQLKKNLSDEEIKIAEVALLRSKKTEKDLENCLRFINIFYTPFKEGKDKSTPNNIFDIRASLRIFRDEFAEHLKSFKISAFYLLECLEFFKTDHQTILIITSFNSYISELEDLGSKFIMLFDDLKSKEFTPETIEILDKIIAKIEDILDMINNRINKHIKDNILAISWRDELAVDLNKTIKNNVPIILKLEQKGKLDDND